MPDWVLVAAAATAGGYALLLAGLALAGRRTEAAALARFVPDCVVLLQRILRDPRVPRGRKAVLLLLVAYLASPIDLVPDFFPVIGQVDDVLVAALALRYLLRGGGPELLEELWPGPEASLAALLGVAFGRRAAQSSVSTRCSGSPASSRASETRPAKGTSSPDPPT